MKKAIEILLIVIAIIVFIVIKSNNSIQVESGIEQMLQDIFAPKTMEQFDNSRQTYENKLISSSVADAMYVKNNDKLTEQDLKRSIETDIHLSKINSYNRDCYITDMWLYNDGLLEKHVRYKFMYDGEIIDAYDLEVLE